MNVAKPFSELLYYPIRFIPQYTKLFENNLDTLSEMSQEIESKILVVGNLRVILDSDLAKLYGVSTKRLNQQVTRNLERFPVDFMFNLSFQV